MKFTDNKRKSKGMASSRMLVVLLALWVSLGIQPCAVAAVSDSDCPHCPELEMRSIAPSIAPENEHCGNSAKPALEVTAASECCDAEDGAIDTRLSTVDVRDLPVVAAVPLSDIDPPWMRRTIESVPAVDPPDWRRSTVPLYMLNCVYRN